MPVSESESAFDEMQDLQLAWLAGLLEAEGTFLAPPPSQPRSPAIVCYMGDEDVIERVARLFGTGAYPLRRADRRRVMFLTKTKGARAMLLMNDLLPHMGERRGATIRGIRENYTAPVRKLSHEVAREIRIMAREGLTVSELSRRFDVARSTIRQVRDGRIYKAETGPRWRHETVLPRVEWAPDSLALRELYWLAGWLEGEGSFCRPPPSDRRRVRIAGCTCDRDVADEVARLLAVSPRYTYADRERRNGWSPIWRVLKRGSGAVRMMRALHPLMGRRRQGQIAAALAAVGERVV